MFLFTPSPGELPLDLSYKPKEIEKSPLSVVQNSLVRIASQASILQNGAIDLRRDENSSTKSSNGVQSSNQGLIASGRKDTIKSEAYSNFETDSETDSSSHNDSKLTRSNDTRQSTGDSRNQAAHEGHQLTTRKKIRERTLLPCHVCGKAFDRPSLLKRHIRTHTGELFL